MIKREKEGIEWLEFEQLQAFPELVHGVLLKSLDFKYLSSHEKVEKLFSFPKVIRSHLEHGNRVEVVPQGQIPKCDAIATSEANLGLVVTHADCQAAIFYDPIKQVIANVHCGWRGNVKNIYSKTVEKLEKEWGVCPKDLLVCISPSLGPDAAEFMNYKDELPASFLAYQVKPKYFDLWAIARAQLEEAGVPSQQIEIAEICTFSDENHFFSYRRDKEMGRHGTVIAMKG